MKNYRRGTEYKKYYDLIESSDVYVNPMVTVERDYVLCFLKYRTGNVDDYHDIEPILAEYFNEDIDFSQHIRIGILLFLLYCNRLGDYKKAKQTEKTITRQIQKALAGTLIAKGRGPCPPEYAEDNDGPFLHSPGRGKGVYNVSGRDNRRAFCPVFERNITPHSSARGYCCDGQYAFPSRQGCQGNIGGKGHESAVSSTLQP